MPSAYVNLGWLVSLKWILGTWRFLQNKTKSTENLMQHIRRAKKVGQIFSVWTSSIIQSTEEIPKVKKCYVADSVNKCSMLVVHLLRVDKQREQFTDDSLLIPRLKLRQRLDKISWTTMNTAQMAPHLLLLCFLKLVGSVIVMKDRNYEAVNTTHTKLSFKMTSRGRFCMASSQDQALQGPTPQVS